MQIQTIRYSFLLLLGSLLACSGTRESDKPRHMPLTEAVYASGNIKAYNQYTVSAAVSGILQSRLVNENDLVKEGQILAEIRDESGRFQTESAQALYQEAKRNYTPNAPRLRQLDKDIETLQVQLKNDSLNVERFRNLLDHNATTQVEFESRQLRYLSGKNKLEALLLQRADMEQSLQTRYRDALNTWKASDASNNERIIRSFVDGKVYSFYKHPGELVRQHEALAIVGDAGRFIVELIVDEQDINRVKIGQQALISLDTYENAIFKARISRIYPELDIRTQTFRVEAEFEKQPEQLYPGLTAEANIIIREKTNALVIKKAFLQPGDSVLLDKGLKQKIRRGIENLEYVEILSGPDTATVIYK